MKAAAWLFSAFPTFFAFLIWIKERRALQSSVSASQSSVGSRLPLLNYLSLSLSHSLTQLLFFPLPQLVSLHLYACFLFFFFIITSPSFYFTLLRFRLGQAPNKYTYIYFLSCLYREQREWRAELSHCLYTIWKNLKPSVLPFVCQEKSLLCLASLLFFSLYFSFSFSSFYHGKQSRSSVVQKQKKKSLLFHLLIYTSFWVFRRRFESGLNFVNFNDAA